MTPQPALPRPGPPGVPGGPGRLDPGPLDAADPLASFRDRFAVPDPDLVYLDGNSLCRAPRSTLARVAGVAGDEWAGELVRAWDHWLDLPLSAGDVLAAGVLGAAPGTVAVTDSTTVNLYRVASAALDDLPGRGAVVAARDASRRTGTCSRGLRRAAGCGCAGWTGTRCLARRRRTWRRP